jgi:hypothetical protein
MSNYRYFVTQLYQSGSTANPIVAEIPFTNVNFTQEVNNNGTFSGEILLSGLSKSFASNVINKTIPAQFALYIEFNGNLVWGGVIWNREYNSDTQLLTISGQELMSYFNRRVIYNTSGGAGGSTVFTNQDPCYIANELIIQAQAASYGNIGVDTNLATVSGYSVSRTYYNFELKTVYQAIKDLSTGLDAGTQTPFFDFRIVPSYQGSGSSTYIYNRFTMGVPYMGNGSYDPASIYYAHVFDFPGNIISYTYPEDGTTAANTVYGLGYGANVTKLIATAVDSTKLGTWPLLESSASYIDINDPTLLKSVTLGQVQALSYPPTTVQVVIPSYVDPQLNVYKLGDFARLSIYDDFFPSSTAGITANEVYRIVSISVSPGENGPDRVTLTLTLPLSGTGTVS